MYEHIPPLADVRRLTQKKRDAWWTVLLVDPVATPLVRLVARTRVTPNQITWAALVVGLGSAVCFARGGWPWLVAGALVYHLSFVLDCMDGKLARLTGTGSVFGAWLDYVFDRIRVMACAAALMGGQYERTGDVLYIWLAVAVIFLDGLRYINSLEIFKVRHSMRKQIKARMRAARRAENEAEVAFMEDLLRDNPEADAEQDLRRAREEAGTGEQAVAGAQDAPAPDTGTPDTSGTEAPAAGADGTAGAAETAGTAAQPPRQVIDLHREFRHRFPVYLRLRSFLLRHRIRTHLVSGIEFQMGVFIVGPLCDAVVPAAVVSGGLLLVFELAIIYKLLLSTRDFARTLRSFGSAAPQATEAAGEAPGAADGTASGADASTPPPPDTAAVA